MAVAVTIEGFDEARKVLDVLPDKFQVQTIRKIFRKSAQSLIDDSKRRCIAHNPAHQKLADAIGFITVRTKDPIVITGIRAKGKYKNAGFMGHWVEYGVSGIKRGFSRNLTKEGDDSFRFWVSSVEKGGRYRHDMPPQPFMRPAIDSKQSSIKADVSKQFGDTLHTETERALKRSRKSNGAGYAKAKNRVWYG